VARYNEQWLVAKTVIGARAIRFPQMHYGSAQIAGVSAPDIVLYFV